MRCSWIWKDLAPSIYFSHLKYFFFSPVPHFVSAKEPCLSSRTYHIALADWLSGQQKNKLMSLGCEYLAAPHFFNGSQQYQFTERWSSPPGTIYLSVYCAQMRPFILLEFNFGFLSKRQKNLNSESVPIIRQQWIKWAQCDCAGC